jgi:signal transduction histidine kinase
VTLSKRHSGLSQSAAAGQQLKSTEQFDFSNSSTPPQTFAAGGSIGGAAGGGGGGGFGGGGANGINRNAPASSGAASPIFADSPSASAANATPQAFTLGDNAARKFNDGLDRNESAPAGAVAGPVISDSILPAPQPTQELATAKELTPAVPAANPPSQQTFALDDNAAQKDVPNPSQYQNTLNYKSAQSRKVSPQSQIYQNEDKSKAESADDLQNNLSKVVPAEAEFRQLIGDQTDGMLARFLQNKLKLMCWHRLNAKPDLIFGAQLNLDRVVDGLRTLVQGERSLGDEICLAVLDDNARPVVLSREKFLANWKRPFVATEVGDALPHWEVAAYLVNPAQLTQAAQTARLTLGLLIALLVVAIGVGSLLIVRGLGTELKLARQKTDFVSNVSHELKTPLTSIRMFSELLAEGRVNDQAKQRSYLQIITAEAARLTRLINNVLDFSRMERGEKKYNFQPCDLTDIVRSAAETFRPHLEGGGFQFVCELPATQIPLRGDADALSQIIVNLLSNAEKYSGQPERLGGPNFGSPTRRDSVMAINDEPGLETGAPPKEIFLQLARRQSPLPHVEVRVLDRGPGVPRGSEEKIFEKFYRAHDSLSSGIQGSGLGLTIARQIARAHGGDVIYEPRDGGGSCFILRLPVQTS